MKRFEKSYRSMIENIGIKKNKYWNKFSVQFSLILIFMMFSFLSNHQLMAQGSIPPYCSTCTAEDIKMVGVDIITGNNGNCYNPGENVTGFFKFKMDVTAKQRYGLVIYFEIWVDGVAQGKFYTCMDRIFDQGYQEIESFNGNKFPVPAGIPPGQIMVKNMFTAWDNQYPDLVCGKTSFVDADGNAATSLDDVFTVDCSRLSPKCKFYAEVPLVNLAVKPSVSLSSVMPALCPGGTSTTLSFTNRSSGADEYQITYDNAARNAGFSNMAYQLLAPSPINLAVPANAPSAIYNGVLTLRNTISGCESQPYNFTVTVKDNVFIATQPTVADTYCTSGPGPQLKVVAGGEQPYSYQWYMNASSSNNGGTSILDATTDTYNPSVSEVGTSYYYAVINGGCGPAVNSNPVTVLVNKNTNILDGGQPVSGAIYCKDATAVPLSVSAEGANVTYQWYRNSTIDNTGGEIINGAIANSYNPSTSADGTLYYYVVVSGKCGTVTSTPASVLTKKTTVINSQPSGATYCTYSNSINLQVSADGYNIRYQWYLNSTNSTVGGTAIEAATNASYKPSVSNAGTIYYFVKVMADCGDVYSNPAAILVDPSTQINTQPLSSATYCKNASATALTVVAGGKNLTYQWYSNNSNSTAGGTAVSGATNASYTPPTANDGTKYYYVVVGGACGTVTSGVSGIVVNKLTSISSHPQGATYCPTSSPADLSVAADGTGLTYQWYVNGSNVTSGATAITGATHSSYTPSVSQSGTKYYYVVVSGSCGSVNSDFATIVVDPSTQITIQPSSSATYCKNASATALTVVASGKNITYQWYSNNSNSTSDGTVVSGATNASYTPPTANDGTKYYYVVVGGACGNVTSGVSGIVVNKLTSISSHPQGATYCPTSSPADLSVTADGTGLTYQWYVNGSSVTTGATAITGATHSSYTPSVSQSGTKYYYVVVSGSCGSVNSDFATIVVDPSTQITTQPSSATYCKNASATALTVVAGGKNLTYQWYSNGTNSTIGGTAISGETNTSYTPPTITNGRIYYYVLVTGTCGSVASSVSTITVNKLTEIKTQPTNSNVCEGGYASPLFVAASGTSLTYQWYSNSSNTNVGGTAIAGATTFSYIPSTTVGSPNFYYIVISGACGTVTSTTVSVVLTKNTEIKNSLTNAEYCQDGTSSDLVINADGAQLTYQWYANSIASESGSYTLVGQTNASFTPPTNTPGTTYYYVVVTGFCGQNQMSNFASVLVKGKPAIQTQPTGDTYCKDASTTNLSVIATGTGLTYQWYSNSINSTVGGTSLGTSSVQSISSSTVGSMYYYVVVSGSCAPSVVSDIVTINVTEKAAITKQPTGYTLCRTAEGTELSVEATGAGKTYQWFKSFSGAEGTFISIPNATEASYLPDVSVVGTLYYYVQVSASTCGSVKSNVVSVMVTDCGAFCTYTQGYYGNDGGTSTYLDASGCVKSNTYNAISNAINAFGESISGVKTITFGGGSNKLVLRNTDSDIKKLIDLLPGGGTSGVIGGDYTIQNIGSLSNSLLAQTITLALNLGLNKGGNMIGYPLQSKFLKTEKAKECGKEGGFGTFDCADFTMLSNDIDVDGMPGLTINDVWIAANKLLAGESVGDVDFGTMTAIVDGLNKGWDECRISIEWTDSKASCGQAYTLANNGIESFAYPNPFVTKVNISFKSLASGNATIQMFDITGRKLGFIYRPKVIAGTTNVVEYNVPLNSPSVIFYRVTIGDKFATGKVIAASR